MLRMGDDDRQHCLRHIEARERTQVHDSAIYVKTVGLR